MKKAASTTPIMTPATIPAITPGDNPLFEMAGGEWLVAWGEEEVAVYKNSMISNNARMN
jgi:hypothetical protein